MKHFNRGWTPISTQHQVAATSIDVPLLVHKNDTATVLPLHWCCTVIVLLRCSTKANATLLMDKQHTDAVPPHCCCTTTAVQLSYYGNITVLPLARFVCVQHFTVNYYELYA
eukprot:Lankesteria_metandrocarpae@DN5812_c0_g1_i1.p1